MNIALHISTTFAISIFMILPTNEDKIQTNQLEKHSDRMTWTIHVNSMVVLYLEPGYCDNHELSWAQKKHKKKTTHTKDRHILCSSVCLQLLLLLSLGLVCLLFSSARCEQWILAQWILWIICHWITASISCWSIDSKQKKKKTVSATLILTARNVHYSHCQYRWCFIILYRFITRWFLIGFYGTLRRLWFIWKFNFLVAVR